MSAGGATGSRLGGPRLALGWARVELLERMRPALAAALTAPGRRLTALRASRSVAPLRRWERISEQSYATYTQDPNVARIRRVVESVGPGERVLDIGFGFGYVAGVLLRSGRVSYYCGTDLKPLFLDSAESMVEANGLTDIPHSFEILDVYELDREFVARHDPSIVLLLEVLEHVEDPAGALARVAEAVPPGTRALFTVPLFGRLERVWGHRSLFDAARVRDMCAEAGLAIERVEPIQNTWCMVAARAIGPAGGDRRLSAGRGSRDGSRRRGLPSYTFAQLPTVLPRAEYLRGNDTAMVELQPQRIGVRCTATVPDGAMGGAAGIRLPIARPQILRLELSIDPPEGARALHITGHDASGRQRLHWRWGGDQGPPSGTRMTHVLKPGERSKTFLPAGGADPDAVEWLEVWMELDARRPVTLILHRADFIGDRAPAPVGSGE